MKKISYLVNGTRTANVSRGITAAIEAAIALPLGDYLSAGGDIFLSDNGQVCLQPSGKKIVLPERAVVLPYPSWAQTGLEGDWGCSMLIQEDSIFLESEATEILRQYVAKTGLKL